MEAKDCTPLSVVGYNQSNGERAMMAYPLFQKEKNTRATLAAHVRDCQLVIHVHDVCHDRITSGLLLLPRNKRKWSVNGRARSNHDRYLQWWLPISIFVDGQYLPSSLVYFGKRDILVESVNQTGRRKSS